MTRTVVIVSPHFPPSPLAGAHRARQLAKHLPAHGWRPIVLRVDERFYAEPGDPELAALVPRNVTQVRTAALPARLTRLMGFGDIGLRALAQLRSALRRLIAAERPEAVLITGSPFYPMLLAADAQAMGVPAVLDFQDPWVSAHGATQPIGSKAWLAHRLALALEPRALRGAAFVTSVSEVQNAEMAARYPWLDAEQMASIPIGGDPDDFVALSTDPPSQLASVLDPSQLNISYVGAWWPRAAPVFARTIEAMAQLRARWPALSTQVRFNFVGTGDEVTGAPRVAPLAQAAGIGELVRETPRRVPYLTALGVLARSDALLLIGSDEPHYTASKIYPALISGRPWLSLFHRDSSAHAVLAAAGGGRAFAFADEPELNAAVPALAEGLRQLATERSAFGPPDPAVIAPYLAPAIAGRFAAVFDQVARP